MLELIWRQINSNIPDHSSQITDRLRLCPTHGNAALAPLAGRHHCVFPVSVASFRALNFESRVASQPNSKLKIQNSKFHCHSPPTFLICIHANRPAPPNAPHLSPTRAGAAVLYGVSCCVSTHLFRILPRYAQQKTPLESSSHRNRHLRSRPRLPEPNLVPRPRSRSLPLLR